jgi:hypothetical protein
MISSLNLPIVPCRNTGPAFAALSDVNGTIAPARDRGGRR